MAREALDQTSAEVVFEALSLLKGTALKIAQTLSLELDIFPPAVRKELEKSYNRVPPLNRALVRKVIQNEFGLPPETVFRSFDSIAFAAASLGQVHRATGMEGADLAVKVQYPGIKTTIKSDIEMVKTLFRPLPDFDFVFPALREIELRLFEETDYTKEAENMRFFTHHLEMAGVTIPVVDNRTSGETILSTGYMPGPTLNEWLATHPPQADRDRVAQVLHDLFLKSLYELNCIHADPHPGNFIINPDLSLGLLDFGCVKSLPAAFVKKYATLVRAAIGRENQTFLRILKELKVIADDMDPEPEALYMEVISKLGRWFGKLFEADRFDFGENADFFAESKQMTEDMYRLRGHVEVNPHFVFLDRTRYGLLRLFETMRARVRIRNRYEWDG
jgi:predicted unusual protein kinase regulating ubiquinone biosynthesis (AarF/ABC1/UbiB family)